MNRRVVIDRGHEVLYVSVTHEGLIVDALPVGEDDVEELGGWTWDEMECADCGDHCRCEPGD